jgi:hypothetical protein
MVLQDGGDGVVGARAEHQRTGAGGVDLNRTGFSGGSNS